MKDQKVFLDEPLILFYELLRENITMSGFRKGAIQDFTTHILIYV